MARFGQYNIVNVSINLNFCGVIRLCELSVCALCVCLECMCVLDVYVFSVPWVLCVPCTFLLSSVVNVSYSLFTIIYVFTQHWKSGLPIATLLKLWGIIDADLCVDVRTIPSNA